MIVKKGDGVVPFFHLIGKGVVLSIWAFLSLSHSWGNRREEVSSLPRVTAGVGVIPDSGKPGLWIVSLLACSEVCRVCACLSTICPHVHLSMLKWNLPEWRMVFFINRTFVFALRTHVSWTHARPDFGVTFFPSHSSMDQAGVVHGSPSLWFSPPHSKHNCWHSANSISASWMQVHLWACFLKGQVQKKQALRKL